MHKLLILITAVLLAAACQAQKQKKALFVIVDGIPADLIEKLNTPALDEIARAGGYARAHVGGDSGHISQTPTISAVGYNSLLTATWVNKHNVWDNDIAAPNYNYWNIFRLFKQQFPRKKTAVFSTWLDNRTKLVGSAAAAAGNLQPDFYFDGLELDTINFPHDKEANYIRLIDELVTDTAAAVIRREAPDLAWVYLEFTDDMGHQYGDSKQFYDAIENMDRQVNRLWQAVRYREKEFNEEWVVYITTDHGRTAADGKHHGGQSPRERGTWIVTSAKNLNSYFFNENPGVVDIAPSIARHLGLEIPKEKLWEMDGISLTGKLSAIKLHGKFSAGSITLSWKPVTASGNARVLVSTTNYFKEGKTDTYKLLATVPVSAGGVTLNVTDYPASLYKIVVEMPHNILTRWIEAK